MLTIFRKFGKTTFLEHNRIADILCRAGLHLSASTVKRIIDEPPIPPPELPPSPEPAPDEPTVQAWYPNHIWSVDLTVVPSTDGLWTPWSPNALSQVHPYSWYVMVVIDHYSRRIMGFDIFEQNPTANQITSSMQRICDSNGVKPKYLVSDQGSPLNFNPGVLITASNNVSERLKNTVLLP